MGKPGPEGVDRILIVDDERAVADSTEAIFRMHGWETKAAYSAEAALEAIAEWQPDAALIDVMLPGMNGVELAAVVQDNYPQCGILLFSGCDAAGELLTMSARRGRRFPILAKPVYPTDVLKAVRELLAERIAERQEREQLN